MADNKYLWRVSIHRVPRPLYVVSQNVQSAAAQASAHPQVEASDVGSVMRLDLWDPAQNMTKVPWPEPPPEPEPEEPPTP